MQPDLTRGAAAGGPFHTTCWSVFLRSRGDQGEDGSAREALAQLCRTYWRPVFAFVCQRGYPLQDAQDLTQEFFLFILKGDFFQQATPERGRFRSLLLKSLQNFLINTNLKSRAQKRGGEIEFVSWDDWMAESPSHLSLPAKALEHWSAEKVFDVRWAATLAEQALRRLQEELERHGRRRVFDSLSGWLTADRQDISYEKLARQLGVETDDIKSFLYQMRQRYRQLLRDQIAETVAAWSDIDEELRYLVTALASSTEEIAPA